MSLIGAVRPRGSAPRPASNRAPAAGASRSSTSPRRARRSRRRPRPRPSSRRPGRSRRPARRARAGELGLRVPPRDELGQDRDRDLLLARRTEVEPGRAADARERLLVEARSRGARPAPRRRASRSPRARRTRRPPASAACERLLVALAHRRDDDRVGALAGARPRPASRSCARARISVRAAGLSPTTARSGAGSLGSIEHLDRPLRRAAALDPDDAGPRRPRARRSPRGRPSARSTRRRPSRASAPSGVTIARSPLRAEAGRSTPTTVASANGLPSAASRPASTRTSAGSLRQSRLLERGPDLVGGDRHLEVPHAGVRERVDDRVDVGGGRADGRRLADALRADRVVRRRRDRLAELERRRLPGGRDQVVHEVRADAVAVLVEGDQLHRGDREALGEAAHDLALDDHRVDPHAAVVDGDDALRPSTAPVPRSISTTTAYVPNGYVMFGGS